MRPLLPVLMISGLLWWMIAPQVVAQNWSPHNQQTNHNSPMPKGENVHQAGWLAGDTGCCDSNVRVGPLFRGLGNRGQHGDCASDSGDCTSDACECPSCLSMIAARTRTAVCNLRCLPAKVLRKLANGVKSLSQLRLCYNPCLDSCCLETSGCFQHGRRGGPLGHFGPCWYEAPREWTLFGIFPLQRLRGCGLYPGCGGSSCNDCGRARRILGAKDDCGCGTVDDQPAAVEPESVPVPEAAAEPVSSQARSDRSALMPSTVIPYRTPKSRQEGQEVFTLPSQKQVEVPVERASHRSGTTRVSVHKAAKGASGLNEMPQPKSRRLEPLPLNGDQQTLEKAGFVMRS